MINKEALHNLVHSQWWQEFKKIVEEKRLDLSKKIIDKPKWEWEAEILKIKTMEEMLKKWDFEKKRIRITLRNSKLIEIKKRLVNSSLFFYLLPLFFIII